MKRLNGKSIVLSMGLILDTVHSALQTPVPKQSFSPEAAVGQHQAPHPLGQHRTGADSVFPTTPQGGAAIVSSAGEKPFPLRQDSMLAPLGHQLHCQRPPSKSDTLGLMVPWPLLGRASLAHNNGSPKSGFCTRGPAFTQTTSSAVINQKEPCLYPL